jgi:hypothetical protein
MEDVELVLRFFALKDSRYLRLRKGFREFITASLLEFNDLDQLAIAARSDAFKTYMDFLLANEGSYAFAKWRIEGQQEKRMSTFNAAVYDAVAVGLAEVFSADDIRQNPGRVAAALSGYKALFADKEFFASVSGSVNDAAKVQYRINAVVEFLRK